MRRLPIFFALDCSESMTGEKREKMQKGLQAIVQNLRTDPHALETVYLSVLAFAGKAEVIAPLVELPSFYPPKLPLGSGTYLGNALDVLTAEIDRVVVKTTAEAKGDWRPIVYLFTDGCPTDHPQAAVERWQRRFAGKITVIAVTLGKEADFALLQRLTEHVIIFEDRQEGDFTKFIRWVTASVVAQSKSVGEGKNLESLPDLDESVMEVVKRPPAITDESCVVLTGRCQKTRKPYLIKYEREIAEAKTRDFNISVPAYHLKGCFPIDEEYFAWSEPNAGENKVNTSSLVGVPACPHCGNITAFALCSCGKLMCINGPGEVVCPWCKKTGFFGEGGGEGFDVGRGRG